MHETILEDRLDDRADAVRDGIERGELGLHVGGKRGVRCGADIDRSRPPAAHVDLDPVVTDCDARARLLQFAHDRVDVFGTRILHAHMSRSGDARRPE